MTGSNFAIVINYVITSLYLIERFSIVRPKTKTKAKKLHDVAGAKRGNMLTSMSPLVVTRVSQNANLTSII